VRRRQWSYRRENPMIFDYVLAGLVTLGVLVYLLYALLRPERF
jgi:K+-transporting ATPase KdpF subunit